MKSLVADVDQTLHQIIGVYPETVLPAAISQR
jgi:hypothetical protein